MWEPGIIVAGAAPAQVLSLPVTLKPPSPPYSFPFSWLLVWLFIAYLDE